MTSLYPIERAAERDQRRLRILLVVEGYYPSTGGAEMQVRTLSRAFAARGHAVRVLAPRLDPGKPVRETIDGIEVERIAYPKIRLFGALILCARFALRLFADRHRYDAIHVHTAKNLAAVAGLLRPWLDATLAVKISGAWEFEGGILDPGLRDRLFYRFLNRCVRRADVIQCVSVYTHRRLVEAGYPNATLRILPNAVDLERFAPRAPGLASDTCRVVFVGRLVSVKALPVLIEAWRTVVAQRPDAALVIAGDGPQRAELESQARALGVAARVKFVGEVRDVPAVLSAASVYVQPSYTEGMPNAVLEAMAAGLPIVATRVSGNEDLVEDGVNGLLVPAGDAQALARALAALLDDGARARDMGRRSRDIVERRYAIPAVVAQLVEAYRQPHGPKPETGTA